MNTKKNYKKKYIKKVSYGFSSAPYMDIELTKKKPSEILRDKLEPMPKFMEDKCRIPNCKDCTPPLNTNNLGVISNKVGVTSPHHTKEWLQGYEEGFEEASKLKRIAQKAYLDLEDRIRKRIRQRMKDYANTPLSSRRNAFDELYEVVKELDTLK